MPSLPEPDIENRFPDCVAMKLHFDWVQPKQKGALSSILSKLTGQASEDSEPFEINMYLTINFNGEQEIEVPGARALGISGGKATFGIQRGKLLLHLTGCKMLLEAVTLNAPLKVSIAAETQQEKASEGKLGFSVSVTDKPSLRAEGILGGRTVQKMATEVWQVQKTGGEQQPGWIFAVETGDPTLRGLLALEKLGSLQVDEQSKTCKVEATFTVRGEDIVLTWGQMGWTSNIVRNKLALIERAIALRYIAPQLEPALSEVKWQYG